MGEAPAAIGVGPNRGSGQPKQGLHRPRRLGIESSKNQKNLSRIPDARTLEHQESQQLLMMKDSEQTQTSFWYVAFLGTGSNPP
ncbi:hypothetical protein Taro_026750 [Colocasia esculenta]|uniref:Uncharacterized protein n=1 Tax=Colocasia esculenta TaxID=4460 RepID=A0A843VPI8_COLES|nr:hypothetical protein [Colocasia esculenta]